MEDELRAGVVLGIFRANNLLLRAGGRLTTGADLDSVQKWLCLGEIARSGELSMGELCRSTLVTKQNVTAMVDRLAVRGLVSTAEDPADRRVVRVRLTPQGRQALEGLREPTRRFNAAAFAGIKAQELAELARLLTALVERLRQLEE